MAEQRKTTILYVIAAFSVLIAAMMVISALYFGPRILSSDTNTKATKDSAELSSCRALYSARVTAATSELLVDGFRLAGDRTDENVAKVHADGDAVDAANAAYQDAAQRANDDAQAFLVECRKNPPGP